MFRCAFIFIGGDGFPIVLGNDIGSELYDYAREQWDTYLPLPQVHTVQYITAT